MTRIDRPYFPQVIQFPRRPEHAQPRPQVRAQPVDVFEGPSAAQLQPEQLKAIIEQVLARVLEILRPGALNPPPGRNPDLAPTPLREGEVPGQIAEVNTPENKQIARKSQFSDAVNEAIDAVRAKGIGIDPEDRDRITDFDTYHQAVVTELRGRGFNAAYDGEELAIGRKGDDFSEQFDISTWQGRVRRFYASYNSPPVWAE